MEGGEWAGEVKIKKINMILKWIFDRGISGSGFKALLVAMLSKSDKVERMIYDYGFEVFI